MAVDYLIEIFGGTGAVVLGIATCIWGFCKTHELHCKCVYINKQA